MSERSPFNHTLMRIIIIHDAVDRCQENLAISCRTGGRRQARPCGSPRHATRRVGMRTRPFRQALVTLALQLRVERGLGGK